MEKDVLIEAVNIKKYFPVRRGLFAPERALKAVDGVNFSVRQNTVFGIVGESGSGKSTLARIVLALAEPTSGEVFFRGVPLFARNGGPRREKIKKFRRAVQIIFQDPFASLNPRKTVLDAVSEPIKIHRLLPGDRIEPRVIELLASVGLGGEVLRRYPHEFSGGQRQRVCIARALAVRPELIIADEPLSALDVSIQAQILNILKGLKEKTGISFIFISHDLRVIEYLSDEVAVMYLGKIVEQAPAEPLFLEPLHPYTVGLLESAPGLVPGKTKRAVPKGDVPSPVEIPPGCPFHPRCPRRFEPCDKIVPEFREPPHKPGRLVSCHLWNPY